jgi:small subunit ribosomal protein S4
MKFTGPKVKLSRALGIALTLKAARYMEKRPYPPGQHGQQKQRNKGSDYKRQLFEKQRLRFQYNISERQMRNYFHKAERAKLNTGEALILLLERRLDAMVLRGGLAKTIYAARQYVAHGHILVNGRKVDIPSYQVKVGDVIQVKEKSRSLPCIIEAMQYRFPNKYTELNRETATIKVVRYPEREEVPVICEVTQVIEYYSK